MRTSQKRWCIARFIDGSDSFSCTRLEASSANAKAVVSLNIPDRNVYRAGCNVSLLTMDGFVRRKVSTAKFSDAMGKARPGPLARADCVRAQRINSDVTHHRALCTNTSQHRHNSHHQYGQTEESRSLLAKAISINRNYTIINTQCRLLRKTLTISD